jgi:hypothetical protein
MQSICRSTRARIAAQGGGGGFNVIRDIAVVYFVAHSLQIRCTFIAD